MICISFLMCLSSEPFMRIMSLPSKKISPLVGSTRRSMHLPVVVFPQPDSPTIPSVCPFSMEKLTSSTAWSIPLGVLKYFLRFLTSSMFSAILSSAIVRQFFSGRLILKSGSSYAVQATMCVSDTILSTGLAFRQASVAY